MSKIKNIQDLRDRVLQAIDDIESGKIEIHAAATISKLSETIISGLKAEMQYAILTNSEPNIPFFGQENGKKLELSELGAAVRKKLL